MAATVTYTSIDREILFTRTTGEETSIFLRRQPILPLSDSFLLRVFRKPITQGSTAVRLSSTTDFNLDSDRAKIEFLSELPEDNQVYIEGYEYESVYDAYMASLRATIGDIDNLNYRYSVDYLIQYFHKALFEKILPDAESFGWSFTLDTDVNRIEESISQQQLGFITDFAALGIQSGELRKALRGAIVIEDRFSKLDTTKQLTAMKDTLAGDEKKLERAFQDYLVTKGLSDGTLELGVHDNIRLSYAYLQEICCHA